MPNFTRLLSIFREHMNAEMTRSDVLRALIWPIAGLIMALLGAVGVSAADWLVQGLFYFLAGFLILYAISYVFFAVRDPDSLRSEKYSLQKMAMEKGLYGDSESGLKRIDEMSEDSRLIDVSPAIETEDD